LVVEALGPQAIAVGKAADYRIRLENQSDAAAGRVMVVVTLPESVKVLDAQCRLGSAGRQAADGQRQRIVWQAEQVAGRSQHELLLTLEPQTGDAVDLQVDWSFRPATLAATIEVQQPKLAIELAGPREVRYGQTHVFTVKLSNPGNGTAEGVVVDLTAPGAASQPNPVGPLGPGQSRLLELELTAREAGTMAIRAVATAEGELRAEAAHEVKVRRAELAVRVTAPSLLYAGSTATYQIHVANKGDAVAENVILQATLPDGMRNGQGIDSKPLNSAAPRWRLGDLAPGAEQQYTMQCELTAEGQNPVSVQLQSADKLAASGSATTRVAAIADLKLIVNDPKGPLPVGQDADYEIRVVNRGSKEARSVKIVAQFSEGIEPLAADGHSAKLVPGQVLFDPIVSLPAGDSVTLKVRAKAASSGNLRFRAELTCADPETRLVSEETTRYYNKPAAAAAPAVGQSAGESTSWRASAAAAGPTPAARR
jgi:uncharacterized repeat protein (TIGR01451 family)